MLAGWKIRPWVKRTFEAIGLVANILGIYAFGAEKHWWAASAKWLSNPSLLGLYVLVAFSAIFFLGYVSTAYGYNRGERSFKEIVYLGVALTLYFSAAVFLILMGISLLIFIADTFSDGQSVVVQISTRTNQEFRDAFVMVAAVGGFWGCLIGFSM